MEKSIDVIAVGNAVVDVLAQVDEAFLAEKSIAKGRMELIDRPRAQGIYGALAQTVEQSGGSAANTVAGLAALGGRGAFIGQVAGDALGRRFAADLAALGVDFANGTYAGEEETARSMIVVTPDGERSMSTYIGAAAHVTPEDVAEDAVARARMLYLEGYLFNAPETKAAFAKAARLAQTHGLKTAITLSDVFCVEAHREDFENFIERHADIVFANEDEARALTRLDDIDAVVAALRGRAETIVITRSEKGCLIVKEAGVTEVPAEKVARLVDATGAGDLFAAGYLFGACWDWPAERAAALGAHAAAEVISHMGARPEADIRASAKAAGLL